jgi:hypothetical protein
MRGADSRRVRTVAIVGPGQSARPTVAENWLLQRRDRSRRHALVHADRRRRAGLRQNRINPMINAHDEMRARKGLRAGRRQPALQALPRHDDRVPVGDPRQPDQQSAPRIVADEIDAYPRSLGDVKALLDVRRQTFGRLDAARDQPSRPGRRASTRARRLDRRHHGDLRRQRPARLVLALSALRRLVVAPTLGARG